MVGSLRIAVLVVVACFVSPVDTYAGVRAEMRTVLRDQGQSHILTGQFFAQGDKIRTEQTLVGVAQATILDFFSRKIMVLLHEQKIYVEAQMDEQTLWEALVKVGQTSSERYRKKGMVTREVGEETIDGHPCRVFVSTWQNKDQKILIKSWVAKDLENVSVKTQRISSEKIVQETTLHGIQVEKLDPGLFQPPVEYARSPESIVKF